MNDPRRRTEARGARGAPWRGVGVPCPQAQADGVPCRELLDCDDCGWGRMIAPPAVPQAAAPDTPWVATDA